MKKIFFSLVIVGILSLCSCSKNSEKDIIQPVAEKGVLDLRDWDFTNNSSVELRGEWEFYWQQFLYKKDFTEGFKIDPTGIFNIPGIWNDYLIEDKKISGSGYGTYRLRLLINDSFDEILFKVLTIQTASRIYINEKLVSSSGTVGISRETSEPGYKPQVVRYIPDSNILDVIIHISNFDHRQGGIWGSLTIGPEKEISRNWLYNRDLHFFLIGSILIMAFYYFALFFIHKQDKGALYFSFFCLVLALRMMVTGDIIMLDILPGFPWKALIFIEYSTFFISIPLFLLFLYSLFKEKVLRFISMILSIISFLFSLITLLFPVYISSWIIPPFQIITLGTGIYIIYLLIKISLRKELLAEIILIGFFLMFVTVINDILYAAGIINSVYTISYGILFFIIFQSTVMTIRFAGSFNEVERQQKQLSKTNSEYLDEINERVRLEDDLHKSYRKNARTRLAIIMGLAKLAEYRDTDTGTHIERIQEFSSTLAKQLQKHHEYKDYISDEYIDDLHISSMLHDIGKVGIPDSILQKPDKLTFEEFEIMKHHSIIGGDSIKTVELKTEERSFLTLAKEIAYLHHEKWDGSGYPNGIKREEIPLSARITALADVYDALTSDRCYKKSFSHEEAKTIIAESRGSHFDPDIVDAFLEVEEEFREIKKQMQDELPFEI